MNKYQNNVGKFVSPPTFLAKPTKTSGDNQKKTSGEPIRTQARPSEPKITASLNIFYENRTLRTDEHRCEWNFRNGQTKKARYLALKHEKKGNRKKKDESAPQKQSSGPQESGKDPSVTRGDPKCTELEQKIKKDDAYRFRLESFKKVENSLNNIFIFSKQEKKSEISIKPKGPSFMINPNVVMKQPEKVQSKPLEVRMTPSEFGKKNINEILKNHAQKNQMLPEKILTIKDYKIEEETDAKNVPNDVKVQQEEKPKNDEKKKPSGMSLKQLPSKESKKTSELKPESEKVQDEEKEEKRNTHIDQLVLARATAKSSEEQRQVSDSSSVEPSSHDSNQRQRNSEMFLKKTSLTLTPLYKEVVNATVPAKQIPQVQSKVEPESYLELKTNQTRQAELRELVAVAMREHKIFCIFDNHTYIVRPVREELLSRGWMEVIPDRRLIPRRRPPPMGPTYTTDRTERNCNTLEAVLAARDLFVQELQENVSRSSFKLFADRPKILTTSLTVKKSDESLSETPSRFRIVPPGTDKKKSNAEIREFVAKYEMYANKAKERENEIKRIREREKYVKNLKKEKAKIQNAPQPKKVVKEPEDPEVSPSLIGGTEDYKAIVNTIKNNRKLLQHTKTELKNLSGEELAYPARNILPMLTHVQEASSEPPPEEKPVQRPKYQTQAPKSIFTEVESRMISKMIQSANARIHFMWLSIKPGIHLKCFNYSPEIINKFQRTTFCTKIGLWSHLSNMQWYAHEVSHPAKSPRMYNTGEADDLQAFFQDFQITACIGMLKWLCDTLFEKGMRAVQKKKGKVPLKAFEFAIKQCEGYIRYRENEELNVSEEAKVHEEEWNTFLQYFYIIANDNGKIQECSSAQLMIVHTKAVDTLKLMKRHWPEMDIDGRLNIWIMKPYCASCGRGIFMTNNVYYISQHSKYIVQKYIERPLLIYNTKFDIRQWFMITKLTPLEIWMYKECYLRFCSQPFALRNLHESVHLSNNSVQRKYINLKDPNLPDQNMWDSKTFQLYLKTIGFPNAWDDIIYPGMKDAIVSTMLAAQDTFDGPRKNWFEVYGADFMLSANLKEGPWLIEINENPAMDPSTKVTARLCPQMLRDVIKVVVDKRANKNASTGQWEMIYRQNYSPSFGTVDLDVRGKKIAKVPPYLARLTPSMGAVGRSTKKDGNEVAGRLYEFVKCYKRPPKGTTPDRS